ncbi:MAG: hypothetical protein HYS40_01190 [Gemmatimonadetes bacterium]|nr:hypothetical protein [Gemmatimonadota bacterium]
MRRRHDIVRSVYPPILAALLFVACTPATTRPAFAPFPQAQVIVVRGSPEQVTAEANAWLAGDGVQIALASPRDGYLETDWHSGVKLRCWANPAAPGTTRIFVEAVYRPAQDPSRTERDLELPVPKGHDGYRLAERLLTALGDRFGAVP